MNRDPDDRLRSLSTAPLTYEPVGATAGELPAGFRHVRRSHLLGHGRARFEQAALQVMTWQLHRGAGLDVEASAPVAVTGVVVRSGLRLGPIRFVVPCRVVMTVDEPTVRGFAYGTLPGHPASGEERFTVTLEDDGRVVLNVVAFSRPAFWLMRLGSPVANLVQRRITTRYLRALDE
ncbi:MAG: DUF1990 domain-containing protein [Mycobacteriales bacterium]